MEHRPNTQNKIGRRSSIFRKQSLIDIAESICSTRSVSDVTLNLVVTVLCCTVQ